MANSNLTPLFSLLPLLFLLLFSPFFTNSTLISEIKQQQNQEEPYVGVNIGTDISNFLSPSDLVAFLQVQKITHVRLYDADPDILKALAKTKIPIIISVPNNQLLAIYSFRFSSLLSSVHVLP